MTANEDRLKYYKIFLASVSGFGSFGVRKWIKSLSRTHQFY